VAVNFVSPIAGYVRVDNTSSFAYTWSNSTGKLLSEQFMVYNVTNPNNTAPIPPGFPMFMQVGGASRPGQ
jgi:hypothetical protein